MGVLVVPVFADDYDGYELSVNKFYISYTFCEPNLDQQLNFNFQFDISGLKGNETRSGNSGSSKYDFMQKTSLLQDFWRSISLNFLLKIPRGTLRRFR